MILKMFRVIWFFSVLAVSGVLFYVYASLPEVVRWGEGEGEVTVAREVFFYIMLSFMAVFNLFVFVLRKLFAVETEWNIVTWFYGLAILFNLFFVITLSFTSLINSGERFDFSSIGPIIYGSVLLLILWTLSWPVSLGVRRMRA